MKIVNEKTTLVIELSFTDPDAIPVIPSAVRYRLDDDASGAQILDWTDITPTAATCDIVVTDQQNAILDTALELEKKRMTVSCTFGSDNKKATADYVYAVKNLINIT